MAKVSGNMLTTGLRGKIGKMMVFRVIRGKTFASRAPRKPDKNKETVAQRNTRIAFREASRWAKIVLRDPERKEYYHQCAKMWDLTNAYTAAIKDYMRNHQKTVASVECISKPEMPAPLRSQVITRILVPVKHESPKRVVRLNDIARAITVGDDNFRKSEIYDGIKFRGLIKRGHLSSVFPWPRDTPPDSN